MKRFIIMAAIIASLGTPSHAQEKRTNDQFLKDGRKTFGGEAKKLKMFYKVGCQQFWDIMTSSDPSMERLKGEFSGFILAKSENSEYIKYGPTTMMMTLCHDSPSRNVTDILAEWAQYPRQPD